MELFKNLILLSILTLCLSELKAKTIEQKCLDCIQVELTYNKLKEFTRIIDTTKTKIGE